MTHYRLIWSTDQIEQFAQIFLSDLPNFEQRNHDLLNDGVQVIQLLVREKYLPPDSKLSLFGGNKPLEQKLVKKSNPRHLVRLVQRFETPIGSYVTSNDVASNDDAFNDFNDTKINGKDEEKIDDLPQERHDTPSPTTSLPPVEAIPNIALAVYIDLEVKSQLSGLTKLCHNVKQAQDRYCYGNRDASTISALTNLSSQLFNNIHKSSLIAKKYVDLDVDIKNGPLLNTFIEEVFNLPDAITAFTRAIETRNGFHLIFNTTKIPKASWKMLGQVLYEFTKRKDNEYVKMNRQGKECKDKYISVTSSPCLPIPGTIQGGFHVVMLSREEFIARVKSGQ